MQPAEQLLLHDSQDHHPQAHIYCVGLGWFPRTPGGLNRYVYELVHHLTAQGDRIELSAVGLPKHSTDETMGLHNLAEPDSPLWQRLWSIQKSFDRNLAAQADAINLHFALYSLPIIHQLPKHLPLTFTFHGPWALESQQEGESKTSVKLKHWVEQLVYRRCDRFIVLSKAFGEILHREYGINSEQIQVIPGGVDTNKFAANLSRSEARTRLQWPQDRPILFTPRRLVQRMGINNLLEALATIKSSIPDVWLAIAGKGALRQELEKQAHELNLQNHVKFLGYLPDWQLPIAYQAADLTIIPSQALEGFGLVLLESLSCGTPVACTPIGGMPEVIAPFSPHLVTKSSSSSDIATCLTEILQNTAVLPSREACRNYAELNFAWPKIAQCVREALLA